MRGGIRTRVCYASVTIATVLALTLSLQITTGMGQSNEFSTDYVLFTKELSEAFMQSPDKKRAESVVAEITKFMQTAQPQHKDRFITVCNRMRKLRARPFPDYITCLSTFMAMDMSTNISDRNYEVWDKILDNKMGRGATLAKIRNYLEFTTAYATNRALNATKAVMWTVEDSPSIRFEEDKDGELEIEVSETTLRCFAQNDSIDIVNTRGKYSYSNKEWHGDYGTITWERAGLPRSEVYATFKEYDIDLKLNSVTIDSVEFINTNYFKEKLYGSVTHCCLNRATANGLKFPRFETSTDQRMEIKNLFPNIDYNGGFTQVGAQFIGSGSIWRPAEISIVRNDSVKATFGSTSFLMSKNLIESSRAEVNITLDNERITHPGLRFRYLNSNRTIEMTRGHKGIEQAKYRNTYHNMSMDAELLSWHLDENRIDLTMIKGAAQNVVYFESINFYHEDFFRKLWGMNSTHPFQQIADFVRYNGGGGFPVRDFAEYTQMSMAEVQSLLLTLSYDGYVDYYVEREVCRATDRLYNYLQFDLGKKDYDAIRFISIDSTGREPNGYIDLNTKEIHLHKVPGVIVSETHNINLLPKDGEILLKRNRDFEFDGDVEVGLVHISGKQFAFSYDNYELRLDSIDEMRMRSIDSTTITAHGEYARPIIANALNDLSGRIVLDEPDNKSGKKPTVGYPRLSSTKPAKIYYDSPNIQNGQYDREDFYFLVDTFTFDDITRISNSNLPFEGVLHTGIFPDMRQKLKIRPRDNSLGFTDTTPEEGLPIYGGKAIFYNIIDLSNDGLKGIGRIDYVTSRSESKDAFLFLPDHAEGATKDFTVKKTTEGNTFPGVELGPRQITRNENNVEEPGQSWLEFYPHKDKLDVRNTVGKFQMFPSKKNVDEYECEMDGLLRVTPMGLQGVGRTDMLSTVLEGRQMVFTDHVIHADTSFFASYTYNNEESVLQSGELRRDIIEKNSRGLYQRTSNEIRRKYYNQSIKEDTIVARIARKHRSVAHDLTSRSMVSTIDLEKREGYFSFKSGQGNEKGFSAINFKTMVTNYTWDMERNVETIGQKGSMGNRFVSTKERGDSLSFLVPIAIYDRNTDVLRCEDVEYIDVADARVTLKKGDPVNIHKGARIDELTKVRVDVKSDSTSHSFTNANVTIVGAKEYTGQGEYLFVDNTGGQNMVFMGDIHTDNDGITEAKGTVNYDLPIDKYFCFKGDLTLWGARKNLEFDGGAKMRVIGANGPTNYLRFKAILDPAKVRIPVGKRSFWTTSGRSKEKEDEIYHSFRITRYPVHVYSTMLSQYENHNDLEIVSAPEGILYFNPIFGRYEINTEHKMAKADTTGTVFSYMPDYDMVQASGIIDLKLFLTKGEYKPFTFISAGEIRHNLAKNEITASVMAEMGFFLHPNITTIIYNDIMNSNAPRCDSTSFGYRMRRQELYSAEELKAIDLQSEMGIDKATKMLPDEGPVFTFDEMHLTWSTPKSCYVCDTTVNLMMMKYRKVNKKVRLKAEFMVRNNNGSRLRMMMTADNDKWYYIDYKCMMGSGNNRLSILSSNKALLDEINSIKESDRTDRSRKTHYMVSPQNYMDKFIAGFGLDNIPDNPYADSDKDNDAADDGENTNSGDEQDSLQKPDSEEETDEEEE